MKLTFFEKELFDIDAIEKPTIRVNSNSKAQGDLVQKIKTPLANGAFVSEQKNKKIRTIKIPAEYLDFFTDGAVFTGNFKHTKLESGEPEIVSRTQAPQITKDINVSYNSRVSLRQLEEDRQTSQISFASLLYEPILKIRLGTNKLLTFARGFIDRENEAINYSLGSIISAYANFRQFIAGFYSSGLYWLSGALNNFLANTPENQLPNEIFKKEETTDLSTSEVQSVNVDRIYNNFLLPYRETQYWKVTGKIKNIFSVKDFCLRGGGTSSSLVLPVRQSVLYDIVNTQWVNSNGTPRQVLISEQLDAIMPKNLTISNFSITLQSNITTDSRTIRNTQGNTFTRRYYAYIAVFKVTLNGYDTYFNLLRPGYSINVLNLQVGNYGGNIWRANVMSGSGFNNGMPLTISVTNPSGTYQKNSYYSITRTSGWFIDDFGSIRSGNPWNVSNKSDLDTLFRNRLLSQLTGFIIPNINADLNRLRLSSDSYTNAPQINPYKARPIKRTDLVNPGNKISLSDLSISGNSISVNNKRLNLSISSINPVGIIDNNLYSIDRLSDGTIQGVFRNYRLGVIGNIGLNTATLLTQNNSQNETQAGTSEIKQRLPISIANQSNNNYDIVDIDFVNNRISIMKNYGQDTISSREITALGVELNNGEIREFVISGRTSGTFNSLPVSIYTSRDFVALLRPIYQLNPIFLTKNNGVNVPLYSAWINNRRQSISNLRALLTSRLNGINLFVAQGNIIQTQSLQIQSREENQNLLQDVDQSWPHVRLYNILYNPNTKRFLIVLSRNESAPVPDKNYFNSVTINNRNFNFGSSRYVSFNNRASSPYGIKAAEYSWRASQNPLGDRTSAFISFKKSGKSYTNSFDISRLVRKSTINIKDEKDFSQIIGGFYVSDIGFTSTSFYIELNGAISVNAFQTIALKDKDNINYITRQLLTSNAVRTEQNGKTKFQWNNQPEFAILSYNKDYTLEIRKGVFEKEKVLFIPIQSKDNFHFVKLYNQVRKEGKTDLSFELQKTTFTNLSKDAFIAMALIKASDNTLLTGKWLNNSLFKYNPAISKFSIDDNVDIPDSPASGTKVYLGFQIKDRDTTEINILKLTDIYADTFVCLDTNINDLNLIDLITGNPLAHPSDYEELKEIKEGGLRHVFIKLKQPITAKMLNLVIRKTSDNNNTMRINRLLALKTIGCFSQFPRVVVNTNTDKKETTSVINTAHITSKPLSLNYTLDFEPLTKQSDLLLAQDLFSRANEYNEFIIWLSGGDIAPKIPNLLGFRFIDFVKSLAINDFPIQYIDNRFSSGVSFRIDTRQVSKINI